MTTIPTTVTGTSFECSGTGAPHQQTDLDLTGLDMSVVCVNVIQRSDSLADNHDMCHPNSVQPPSTSFGLATTQAVPKTIDD